VKARSSRLRDTSLKVMSQRGPPCRFFDTTTISRPSTGVLRSSELRRIMNCGSAPSEDATTRAAIVRRMNEMILDSSGAVDVIQVEVR